MLEDFFDTEEVKEILRRFTKRRRFKKKYINGHLTNLHDDSMVFGDEYYVNDGGFWLDKDKKKQNKCQYNIKKG